MAGRIMGLIYSSQIKFASFDYDKNCKKEPCDIMAK
jgi:hypothetical protein